MERVLGLHRLHSSIQRLLHQILLRRPRAARPVTCGGHLAASVKGRPLCNALLAGGAGRGGLQPPVVTLTSLIASLDRLWAHNTTGGALRQFSHGSPTSQRGGRASRDTGETSGREQEDKEGEEEGEEEKRKREFLQLTLYMFSFLLLFYILESRRSDPHTKYISWSEFYHNMLLAGEVKSISLQVSADEAGEDTAVVELHEGALVKGALSKSYYLIKIPKGFNFEKRIRQVEDDLGIPLDERIPIKYIHPNLWMSLFLYLALAGCAVVFLRQMMKSMNITSKKSSDFMDSISGGIRKAKITRVDIDSKLGKAVTFKDVAGLSEAKVEVTEFVDYLTKPHRFKSLGAKTPRGALLLGPPGCGKTLLARALAFEAGVPFLAMAGSEFVEMIGGVGAARVRNLFKEARDKAPSIIYIDEIDAIGRSRSSEAGGGGGDEVTTTLNQLLVEMDGMGTSEGVVILASTNRGDILDRALLRAGRFDRHITIDLPTLLERTELFDLYLGRIKLDKEVGVYSQALARLTPGMSGADINNICNEAAIHAARDLKTTVDQTDLDYAVERVVAGVEKKSSLLSPTEKKIVAYHEAGHALVGWMLKHTDSLLRVSIVPRTNNALGFAQYLPSDQKLYSQQELFERMCMALGGRAAEGLIFNHVSTGAQDDLRRVTRMAYEQIRSYGMSETVGLLSYPREGEPDSPIGSKPYSQHFESLMDQEARTMIAMAYKKATQVLEENRDKLHSLAGALVQREVLVYDDVVELIGEPVSKHKG